jgi:hypothetical protein
MSFFYNPSPLWLLKRYLKMLKQKRGHYTFPFDLEAVVYDAKIETVKEILKHLMVRDVEP